MSLPQFVTFTGLDDHTDLEKVKELSSRYPIEWGVLFGGKGPRYPSVETIIKFIANPELRLAAHLCGSYSKVAMTAPDKRNDKQIGKLMELSLIDQTYTGRLFKRFQINAYEYDMEAVISFQRGMNRPVIIQIRGTTFPEPIEGITYLHDESCGTGRLSVLIPSQQAGVPLVGYAGGIGPLTVTSIIAGIDAHNYSLDMETNVRDESDWLDLDKCESVCQQIWGDKIL